MSWLSNFLVRNYVRRYGRPELQSKGKKHLTRLLMAYGYGEYHVGSNHDETRIVEKVLRRFDPKILVDVGANAGNYSRCLLESFPRSRVYSFEPLSIPFGNLMQLSDEFVNRHTAINAGVGNEETRREIFFDPDSTEHASFSSEVTQVPYVTNSQLQMIDVVTLDGYFQDRLSGETIDFIKIDTEGFESEVLAGSRMIIAQHKPMAIQLEFNWHHMFRGHSLFMLSQALPGYTVFQFVPGGLAQRDPKDPFSNIYVYSNFLFIDSDLVPEIQADDLKV